ncbi:hypothetical protein BG015_004971 [Linnemannia schmuckeri]|uniref:Uncharacterized protein n=1 Tax=Linnemannia schmuckeri TaxID=64567 RepID=A0A9P5S145_9FUNG|nr:hypothetical protein BG015_004971 [Linnemannia schmuckeri]
MDSELSPIIRDLLASQLGHQSLGRIALLNKACNKIWIPYLYKYLRINTPLQRSRFMTGKSLTALSRNCRYITAIQTRYPLTLVPFADKDEVPTLRLHTLDILTDARAETLTQEEDLAIVGVLTRSPGLLHLSIRRAPIHPVRILMTIVRYQVALRTLNLFNVTEYDKIPQGTVELAKVFLDRCSAELETLVLALYIDGLQVNHDHLRHGGPLSIAGELPTTRKQHPKLKVFTLVGLQDGSELEWHVLKRFLPGCTSLQILDSARPQLSDGTIGWVTDCSDIQDALGQVKGVWPQPLFVMSHTSRPNEDEYISTNVLSILKEKGRFRPVWHTITIHCRGAGKLLQTAQSIARVCTHDLVRLNVGGSSQFGSKGMQAIFTSCRDLRQFDAFNDDTTFKWVYTFYPSISAKDMISAPWVCRWLTLLHLEIVDVPRPDVTVDGVGDQLSLFDEVELATKEESHEIQRKVYRQLGSLSCLEELYLGHRQHAVKRSTIMQEAMGSDYESEEDEEEEDTVGTVDFLMNCLEFSLESGLDLLAGLKELRILDVTFTCHRIGVPELEWMEINFPNLASLRGLDPVRSMEDDTQCKSVLKTMGFFGPEALTWARMNKIEWLPKEDQTDQEWRWERVQNEDLDADEEDEEGEEEEEEED